MRAKQLFPDRPALDVAVRVAAAAAVVALLVVAALMREAPTAALAVVLATFAVRETVELEGRAQQASTVVFWAAAACYVVLAFG